jgi:hypothetical protein
MLKIILVKLARYSHLSDIVMPEKSLAKPRALPYPINYCISIQCKIKIFTFPPKRDYMT